MKELSIAGKATRYDELLVKLQKAKVDNNVCDERYCCVIDDIVPELKESEDERIRNLLYCLIRDRSDNRKLLEHNGVSVDMALAWIEKQGNKSDIGISEATKQELEDNLNKALEKETPESWNEFLEKEGEQKYIPKYKIGDYVKNTNYKGEPIYEIIYMDKECYICKYRGKERMGDKAVMHFSFDNPYLRLVQKPANKVEPKFKVGDFIVNDYCMGRVVEITNDAYLLDTEQGIPFSSHSTRLWDITKDAKDGDVLATDTWTFIFKKYQDKSAYYHCAASTFNDFSISDTGEFDSNYVHPVTKEQHDLLFQRIKEAGYEWNSEKKELKKIEQNTAEWTEEDEDVINHLLAICAGAKRYRQFAGCLQEDITKYQTWLKTLKDRVGCEADCTNTKEWSKEDEGVLLESISVLQNNSHWVLADKLKSLMPQNRWKPSDEQMDNK